MMAYISHPYTGNEQQNVADAEQIAASLAAKYPAVVFINPLAAMRHEGAAGLGYNVTITHCLKLVEKCDVVIMAGNWEESHGCTTEYRFAKMVDKPVYKSVEDFDAAHRM